MTRHEGRPLPLKPASGQTSTPKHVFSGDPNKLPAEYRRGVVSPRKVVDAHADDWPRWLVPTALLSVAMLIYLESLRPKAAWKGPPAPAWR